MSDEPSKRGNGFLWATLLLVLLPLLYILSIGPAGLIAKRLGGVQLELLRMFYYPVILLHDHTFLREPLEWYVQLWE